MALSGSFSPWPVSVQTRRCPAGKKSFGPQYYHAGDRGGTGLGRRRLPSPRHLVRSRISASLTIRMSPPDSSRRLPPASHEGGCDADGCGDVSGSRQGLRTLGAAPSACQPSIFGRVFRPARRPILLVPGQYAVMFPAFPTGGCGIGCVSERVDDLERATSDLRSGNGLASSPASRVLCRDFLDEREGVVELPSTWRTCRSVNHRLGELPNAIFPWGSGRTPSSRRRARRRPPEADVFR